MIVYRRHQQPGCGGCLLLMLLAVFLLGGAPALFNVLGVLVFGGLLLLFAAVAGFWAFTYYVRRQISSYERSQTEIHNTFVQLLVGILVKIAQIDGVVTREEVATIRRFFQVNLRYNQQQLFWVKDLIKEAMASSHSLDDLLRDFKGRFAHEPRLILLELVYRMLYTKDEVPEAEIQLARRIGAYLEIPAYQCRGMEAKYARGYRAGAAGPAPARDEARYFAILGLEPGADWETIKTSYRKLSMQYHPDKVGHLGEEFRKVAEEKMKELNEAYDYLKKKFSA